LSALHRSATPASNRNAPNVSTAAARQLLLEQAIANKLPREYHAVIQKLEIDTTSYLLTPPWSETDEADFGSRFRQADRHH
jgi:hypothetical protein